MGRAPQCSPGEDLHGSHRRPSRTCCERPRQAEGVTVLNPRGRNPVSLIIDDSTCLVNLAHFCIPHFAEVFPENYKQDWKKLPREIPDGFVREFGEWCEAQNRTRSYPSSREPRWADAVDDAVSGERE